MRKLDELDETEIFLKTLPQWALWAFEDSVFCPSLVNDVPILLVWPRGGEQYKKLKEFPDFLNRKYRHWTEDPRAEIRCFEPSHHYHFLYDLAEGRL